jgi:PKD repeat protein
MRACWIGLLLVGLAGSALRAQDLAADFIWDPSQPKVGEAVRFDPGSSAGNPTQFQWSTSNGFDSAEQRPTFTFATAGTYQVTLVVSRVGPTGVVPPSRITKSVVVSGTISLTGDTPVQVGRPSNVRATPTQCTPGAQGWVWETDGGAISGAANGPSIRVSWAQPGRKTVRARHSACGSAAGTKIIEVNNAPQPRITVNGPVRGRAHQGLRFTAAAANCSPDPRGWRWTAEGGSITNDAGDSVTAVWTDPGSRRVTARNSACGNASGETRVSIENAIALSAGTPLLIDLPPQPAPRAIVFRAETILSCPIQVVARGNAGEELARGQVSTAAASAALGFLPASGWRLELTSQCSQPLGFDIETLSDNRVGATPCTGSRALCLAQRRFQVEVVWQQGNDRFGTGRAISGSDQSGFFWFFNQDNIELIVKILDGRGLNGRFWVFSGALSDVAYWIRVTDTVTGNVRIYPNRQGEICGFGDTSAFLASVPGEPAPEAGEESLEEPWINGFALDAGVPDPADPELITGASGACIASSRTLCLLDKRFSVQVDWSRPETGATGSGTQVAGTDQTGYFWFFDPANLELVVKILDAVSFNGKFWVFYGALSDLPYRITVTDTLTGKVKIYDNPQGNICGVGDTSALSPEPGILQIAGPASARTGQAETYAATVDRCDPIAGAWSWNTSGGTVTGNATGDRIAVTWSSRGRKTITAGNPGCGTSRGTLAVNVEAAGAAPVADFTWSPIDPVAGRQTQFYDLSSNQPATWSWSFGDGGTSTQANPEHAFAVAGTFNVSLTASNQFGSHTVAKTVVVGRAEDLPAPSFTWSPSDPTIGQAIQFSGAATNNPLGFSWDFGDGSSATGQVVTHTYGASGTYSVTLTAINNVGSASVTRSIVVRPAGCSLEPAALGNTINGSWSAACASTHRLDSYARFYTFSLSTTTTVGIDLQSSEDTYLYLLSGSGLNGSVINSNDDSGGSLNSRIEMSLGPGSYTVEATTFSVGRTGPFTLTLSNLGGGGGPASITVSGPSTGEVGHFFLFTATASGCTPLANQWTWAGIFPDSTDNISLGWGGPTTNYDLTATNPGCPGAVGHLLVNIHEGPCFYGFGSGQTSTNTWDVSCASTHRGGSYARYYVFRIAVATSFVFTLSTTAAADPYLFLLDGWGEAGTVLAEDDDSGGSLNSRISITLQPGFYTLEATTLTPGQTGSFTISAQ